jgi:hypothetical protein
VAITGKSAGEIEPMVEAAATALRGAPRLTVYPAATDRRGRARRIVVKGGDDLPDLLDAALGEFRRPRPAQSRYHGRGGGSRRMAVLKVRKYGDPVLRRRATPVGEITPEIRRMIDDMIETMYDEVGIGLAAPQVGISLRLMVVGHEKTMDGARDRQPGHRGAGR